MKCIKIEISVRERYKYNFWLKFSCEDATIELAADWAINWKLISMCKEDKREEATKKSHMDYNLGS